MGKWQGRNSLFIKNSQIFQTLSFRCYFPNSKLYIYLCNYYVFREGSFSSSLIMVVALFTFFSFAWGWKYNTYFFIINRKTHKIRYWSISNSAYGASKYHEYIVLPAFLLPETSNQHEIDEYIKIRKTLQQKNQRRNRLDI